MNRFEWTVAPDKGENDEFVEATSGRNPLYLVFPVCSFVLLALSLTGRVPGIFGWLGLAVGIFGLVWYFLYTKVRAARLWRINSTLWTQAPLRYVFTDDGFTVDGAEAASEMPYSAVKKLLETEHLLVLFNARNAAWVLPKGAYTAGPWEECKMFLAERTGLEWKKVNTEKQRYCRAAVSLAVLTLSLAMPVAAGGVKYIKRPVTIQNGENTVTLTVPYFLQEADSFGEESRYEGNDLVLAAEFFTHDQVAWQFHNKEFKKEVSLKTFADFLQKQGEVPDQMAWIVEGERELYLQYEGDVEFFTTVLHETDKGYWFITFACPGERGDTYFGRFDTWRKSAVYTP